MSGIEELVAEAERQVQHVDLRSPDAAIILLAGAIRRLNSDVKSLEQTLAALLKGEY